MGKIRAFLALNLHNSEKEILKADMEKVKIALNGYNVRWENPEKFHLTIRFLGDVDEEKINTLVSTLDRLKFDFEELEFTTSKTGFFPESKYPNVVFAGLKETGTNSEYLVSSIDSILKNFGIKPDKRFIPHITFGRFSRDKRKKMETLPELELEKQLIKFNSFSLMKSTLTPRGSIYEELFRINFAK